MSAIRLDTVPDLAVFGFEPNAQAVRELLSGVGWDRGTGKRPMADRHEITGTGTLHAGEVAYLDPAHIGGRFFLFPVAVGNNSGNALFYDTPRDPSTSVYICVYTCIYMYRYVHIQIYIYIYIYIYIFVYLYICINMYMYVYMYSYICIRV